MFSFLNKLRSRSKFRLTGAEPGNFLELFSQRGGELFDIHPVDDYTIEFSISSLYVSIAQKTARDCSCEIELLSSDGAGRWFGIIKSRVLPLILGAMLIAVLYLSKFYVWEIEISGNESISDSEILDVLAACGVESGAFWPDFSADNIRSEMLYRIPALSWATVNMHGSLAEVIVVERGSPPEMEGDAEPSDIVAAHSGFVKNAYSLAGQCMVTRGSAVEKGDVLISGIAVNSFGERRLLRSRGSVTAEINCECNAIMPANKTLRTEKGKTNRKYALIIGNKRINFYSGSSISDGFCDKIISVWKAKADGFFSLPISLVCIKETEYETESASVSRSERDSILRSCLREKFLAEFENPEILAENFSFGSSEGLNCGTLRLRCVAEIGEAVAISAERLADTENFNSKVDE